MFWKSMGRRDVFRSGGMLAAAHALAFQAKNAFAAPLELGTKIYQ